jgi:hypothetical protein
MNLRRMHGMRGHRRGYWRSGHWIWLDLGWGDSCYANCIAAGFGPSYCSIYAYNFCD